MKKITAVILSLMLCLGALGALAEVVPFESLGATIELAEGMALLEGDAIDPEIVEQTGAFAVITDEANQAYVLFSYIEDDEITAIDLTELSEDEIAELAASAMVPYEVKEAQVAEIAGEPMLAVTFLDEAGAEQYVLVQFGDGGFVLISFRMADNSQVSEEIGVRLVAAVASLAYAE